MTRWIKKALRVNEARENSKAVHVKDEGIEVDEAHEDSIVAIPITIALYSTLLLVVLRTLTLCLVWPL